MPVKNKKRNSYSYYEGEITGLSDSEKSIIKEAIGGDEVDAELLSILNEVAGKVNTLEKTITNVDSKFSQYEKIKHEHIITLTYNSGKLVFSVKLDTDTVIDDLTKLKSELDGKKYVCNGIFVNIPSKPIFINVLNLTGEAYTVEGSAIDGVAASYTFAELGSMTITDLVQQGE